MDERLLSLLLDCFKGCAVIAGGYVRDRLLGVEPRDCDVFISAPTAEWETVCAILRGQGYHWEEDRPSNDEYKVGHIRATGHFTKNVMGVPVVDDIPINVILTASPILSYASRWEIHIDRCFDYGICKVFMTHNGDIIKLPGFDKDVANKTLTYNTACLKQINDEQQRKHSMYKSLTIRREKLLTKFPDYEVRIE